MKNAILLEPVLAAALAACSPRISLDLLGEDKLQEVVLVPGEAKDKVLMIDINGTISASLETGLLSREKSVDEIVGYFNYYVAGASLVTQPIKPGQPKPPGDAPVDFMVDGCFPPADHSEVWCAIKEIDEINNFKMKRLPAR